MHVRRAWLASLFILCGASTAVSQTESRFALLSAMDRDGAPILGLSADEVVVEEAGVAREILSVAPASYPVAVVLDTSSFARTGFQELRAAVRAFVGALTGREVALYTSGAPATRAVDFTRELARIDSALDRTFARPESLADTTTAIVAAANRLGERHLPLTRIVAVSAGGSDASRLSPRELLQAVLASRSVVDIIDMREIRSVGAGPADSRTRGTRSSRLAPGDEELLRALAERTHGRYERIFAAAGCAPALDLVRRQLLSEIVVEYAAPANAPQDLRLGVRLPGAIVRGIGLKQP